MDLTLLAVAVVVAAVLTWWFMNPPRKATPTGQHAPEPAATGPDPAPPHRLDRPPPAPLDDPVRRRIVGVVAGLLLVLVLVLAFVLARYR